jgi:hypothetical protein
MGNGPIKEEIRLIRDTLKANIPLVWDGMECLLELKEADYNWKQMEWIGWYFEYKASLVLISTMGGENGPTYGNTSFDYKKRYVWDFKAHPLNSSSHPWAIMNDCEAVQSCINENKGLGFIIALGNALYNDENRTFKSWHDELKGKTSDYEIERIKRGAQSRKRKTSFELTHYLAVFFQNMAQIEKDLGEDKIRYFQKGMRNADGSLRRAKYQINIDAYRTQAKTEPNSDPQMDLF